MVVFHRINESISAVEKNYEKLLHKSWVRALSNSLLNTPYMDNLQCYIDETYKNSNFIFPRNQNDLFKPFKLTRAEDVKVVIFGDEPIASGYANGLAFGAYKSTSNMELHSTRHSRNIHACLNSDNEKDFEDFDPTLLTWADQGVLLLNVSLLSEQAKPMKHEFVFRNFIREVIKEINAINVDVVFVFTSQHQSKHFEKYVDTDFNHILHYDGIDPDSSLFEDINQVIEENRGEAHMIQW